MSAGLEQTIGPFRGRAPRPSLPLAAALCRFDQEVPTIVVAVLRDGVTMTQILRPRRAKMTSVSERARRKIVIV